MSYHQHTKNLGRPLRFLSCDGIVGLANGILLLACVSAGALLLSFLAWEKAQYTLEKSLTNTSSVEKDALIQTFVEIYKSKLPPKSVFHD